MAKFLITIDTEPDCNTKWQRSNPETFSSIIYGIPKLLRPIWDKYSVKPIYFVCPRVLNDYKSCIVLREEIKKGAIIGAHLHSEFIEPQQKYNGSEGLPSKEYPCFAYDKTVEFEKIRNLKIAIKEKLNYEAIWYRAARYGADIDTISILEKLGFKYDSSVTPYINWKNQGGPNHSKSPLSEYKISKSSLYELASDENSFNIIEYPITIYKKRFGFLEKFLPDNWLFYNWLRPSHMTIFEQKKMIDKLFSLNKNRTFVMMFHSMEIIINKSPYVRNRLMQKRFLYNLKKTIEYLIEK